MRDRHSQQGSTCLRGGQSGARGGLPEKIFASRRISRRTARRSPAHTPIYAKTIGRGTRSTAVGRKSAGHEKFPASLRRVDVRVDTGSAYCLRQSGPGSSALRSRRSDRTVVMVEQKKLFEGKHRRPPAPRTFSRTFSGILRGPFRGHAFHILRQRAEFFGKGLDVSGCVSDLGAICEQRCSWCK